MLLITPMLLHVQWCWLQATLSPYQGWAHRAGNVTPTLSPTALRKILHTRSTHYTQINPPSWTEPHSGDSSKTHWGDWKKGREVSLQSKRTMYGNLHWPESPSLRRLKCQIRSYLRVGRGRLGCRFFLPNLSTASRAALNVLRRWLSRWEFGK